MKTLVISLSVFAFTSFVNSIVVKYPDMNTDLPTREMIIPTYDERDYIPK